MKTVTQITLAFGSASLVAGLALWSWFNLIDPNPIDKVTNTVRQILNDSDSAKFSKVTFNRQTGFGCGLVNAKNVYGAYAGNKRFVVSESGDVLFDPEKEEPAAPPLTQYQPLRMPSATVNGLMNDAVNSLNETIKRGQEIEKWSNARDIARAENAAFQALIDLKCLRPR